MSVVKKSAAVLIVLGGVGAAAFWWLTIPDRIDTADLASIAAGDAARGEQVFWAGGCTSCHAQPKSEGDAKLRLGGGVALKTAFGTFVAPNISSDKADGIGTWSLDDFANAMLKGVSPEGQHLYPAFPYTSYARMKLTDVADLYAFMKTLPPVTGKAASHQLGFPFTMRRGIGLWKALYLNDKPVIAMAADIPAPVLRGQYLVEGPGHCGECHTPRSLTGGVDKGRWLAGAVAAEGDGIVPNITPGDGGIGNWSQSDIAGYLTTGFTPDFDTVGGAMVEVQKNMALLPDADREAIAAYLKAVPAHPNGYPARNTQ